LPERRSPPPRTVEETDACFIVKDHDDGKSLVYPPPSAPPRRVKPLLA
jgi:hypothetical protein